MLRSLVHSNMTQITVAQIRTIEDISSKLHVLFLSFELCCHSMSATSCSHLQTEQYWSECLVMTSSNTIWMTKETLRMRIRKTNGLIHWSFSNSCWDSLHIRISFGLRTTLSTRLKAALMSCSWKAKNFFLSKAEIVMVSICAKAVSVLLCSVLASGNCNDSCFSSRNKHLPHLRQDMALSAEWYNLHF